MSGGRTTERAEALGLELAIVWHMHQPVYTDPASGEAILPWVRLHASRAYYDMARVLERHPAARVHVNLVPSLLDQLEACAAGRTPDRFLSLTRKPAVELTPPEREFILKNFFMVDWETEVRPIPRYTELLERRGRDLGHVDLPQAARDARPGELLDLQLLFNLAWTGFALREEEPALAALFAKGRGFTEEDKRLVLAAQERAVREIVPLYRRLSEAGQIELTSTPYYHPILPLLIDSDSAREALPDRPMPTRFRAPDDAREQVRRARESHARRFGRPPAGMWPAEGSVSTAAAALFASEGVRWIASDEGVLFQSLPAPAPRSALYRPYRFATTSGDISIVFRDRGLSDLIGFTYSKLPAEAAVRDLWGHLAAIGRAAAEVPGDPGEPPLVCLILDGENPWEHYPQSGRDFLHRLCEALERREGGVTPVLLGERLAAPPRDELPRLHAGSWIESSFRIWIGHEEDRAAWEALGATRRLWEAARDQGLDPKLLAAARDQILIAEGSDWFWWYGDDFTTESAAEFDALFRGWLTAACKSLGVAPPPALDAPISRAALRQVGAGGRAPDDLLRPTIDGLVTIFGEWSGAGFLPGLGERGAMYQAQPPFTGLHYGFDLERLYLRLDPHLPGEARPLALELLVASGAADLPRELRIRFELAKGSSTAGVLLPGGQHLGAAAFADILEVQLPFAGLGLRAGDRLRLSVRVFVGEAEVQRFPSGGGMEIDVPGPEFERIHWRV